MAYKNEGGIYCITCLGNNKKYIGLATRFTERQYHHLRSLRLNKHRNILLQRAYNKYGKDSLSFEILEILNKDDMVEREIYWIKELDTFNNGFNLTEGGEIWYPTQATRDKRSKSLSGENNPMFGMFGELNGNTKLTDREVTEIKYMIKENKSYQEVILKFDITKNQFQKIKHNRNWKHIIV